MCECVWSSLCRTLQLLWTWGFSYKPLLLGSSCWGYWVSTKEPYWWLFLHFTHLCPKCWFTQHKGLSFFLYLWSQTCRLGADPSFKSLALGLPWWHSGWESACRCRGHGFEPWSGRIPHAAEQLSPWATIAEPARLEPVLRNKRGCDSERPAHRDEEWPPLATARESPRTETKTQHSHK